ncbi:hypothetical protein [Hoeflea sp.]|uniref:hypothetical protein n=1 Tax=Hoeflea sp. TaxID=1940281 RepID=UPI0019B8C150|nr:hypothetical protein [Hoeflea sp.]MBC7281169.1 hypothetical protein [Hoeflea sp.]
MIRRRLAQLLTVIIWVFALASLASLALAIVGVNGLLGLEPDPFAAIFAIMLAMPWYFLLDSVHGRHTEYWGFVLLLAGIVLNLGILLGLRGWIRRGLRVA